MNILISGVGGPTPIGIAKSIKMAFPSSYLIGMDANVHAPGLYNEEFFDATYLAPPAASENYWPFIISLISRKSVDFAFIVPETEVLEWARYQMKNELPCNSLIPDFEVATSLFDKYKVTNHLSRVGLSAESINVHDAINSKYESIGAKLGYPYWVRLNKTAGALGAFKVGSTEDLKNWLRVNDEHSDFIASEFLPGRNYACKILYNSGKLVMAASGERIEYLLANSSPTKISGMCARGQLLNRQDLVDRAIQALKLIYSSFKKEPHGMFTVDFKENKHSVPMITEINIRHVSFSLAFSMGGANFVEKTIEHFYHNKPFTSYVHKFDKEYQFIRGVDSSLFIVDSNDLKKNII